MTDIAPFERWLLPNGSEVFYRDGDHRYFRGITMRDGEWRGSGQLVGVSTIKKAYDSGGDGLKWWATEQNNIGVAALLAECLDWDDPEVIQTALAWTRSGPSIDRTLKESKLSWWHVSDRAKKRGTNVHRRALQELAEGRKIDVGALSPEEAGYALGIDAFWRDHQPKPLYAEKVVADLELGIAGRFDLVAECDGLTLFDAKTTPKIPSKRERPYYPVDNDVQVAAYDYLLGRSGYSKRTERQFTLYIDQDGDYELARSYATHSDFRLAFQVYAAAKEIKGARAGKGRETAQIDGQLDLLAPKDA